MTDLGRILVAARLFHPRTCTTAFSFRWRKPAALSTVHLPSNHSPRCLRPWTSVFAFTAESPAALRFLPPFLFSSPTSHLPPAPNTWRGQSFRQPRCQPQALSGRSRDSGFSGKRPKLAFPSPSWTRGLYDSCRPKRSAAPSSGHLENCTLRAVLGSFVNRSSWQDG